MIVVKVNQKDGDVAESKFVLDQVEVKSRPKPRSRGGPVPPCGGLAEGGGSPGGDVGVEGGEVVVGDDLEL